MPSSSSSSTSSPKSYTKTGIGGRGNFHKNTSYLPTNTGITSNEEMLPGRMLCRDSAGSYHHGIGGAGNRACSWTGESGGGRESNADRLKGKILMRFGGWSSWERIPGDIEDLTKSAS